MPDGEFVHLKVQRDATQTDSKATTRHFYKILRTVLGPAPVLSQQPFFIWRRKKGAVEPIASVVHYQCLPVR